MSPDSFVGRERDVMRIEGLLKTRSRLLTVIGVAGVGKTRLACEIARRHGALVTLELASARSMEDFCRLVGRGLEVDLSEARDAGAAAQRIGDALIARTSTSSSAAASLVVLDEFERLAPSCAAAVAGWASRAKSIRFLVTSRVALGVDSETVYELLPLRLPADGESPTASPAVRLFIDRISGARAADAFDATELADLATITRRLEGVPLAIELAAAMLESRTTSELFASLKQGVDDEPSNGPDDPRSLRGAIASAWSALDPAERDALVACCVFRGGLTVEAVAAVVASDNATAQRRVARLRSRALVFSLEVRESMAPRFDVYDSVRHYVVVHGDPERLTACQHRHRSHYLDHFCDWRVADLVHAGLPTLEAEQANLLAVLERSLAERPSAASASAALQVVVALAPLRIGRAPLADYLLELDAAIARSEEAEIEPSLLVMALIARGRVHVLAGRLEIAQADLDRALALAERSCTDEWVARALVQLAIVRRNLGDTRTAVELLERARVLGRSTGQLRVEAEAAGGLARVGRDQGAPLEQAIELAEAAATLARAAGDLPTAARMECRVGTLLVDGGRHDEAAQRFEVARTIAADLGLSEVDAIVAINLAVLAHDMGQLEVAEARYRLAVARTRELGLGTLEAGALMLLSFLLLATDRAEEAGTELALSLRAFEGGREAPYAGLTHIALGATLAARDRIGESESSDRIGAAILARTGDKSLRAAADVLGAHLDLARGRLALRRREPAEAERARNAATERVARSRQAIGAARSAAASASIVRLALAAVRPALALAATSVLPARVFRDARFVDLPSGTRVDLEAQPLSRRILLTLAAAHRESPGRAVARDVLIRTVWPREELSRLVGKNRLHVAVNQLRALGLRDVVLSRDGGYLLAPDVELMDGEP